MSSRCLFGLESLIRIARIRQWVVTAADKADCRWFRVLGQDALRCWSISAGSVLGSSRGRKLRKRTGVGQLWKPKLQIWVNFPAWVCKGFFASFKWTKVRFFTASVFDRGSLKQMHCAILPGILGQRFAILEPLERLVGLGQCAGQFYSFRLHHSLVFQWNSEHHWSFCKSNIRLHQNLQKTVYPFPVQGANASGQKLQLLKGKQCSNKTSWKISARKGAWTETEKKMKITTKCFQGEKWRKRGWKVETSQVREKSTWKVFLTMKSEKKQMFNKDI